jgi:predicted Ser/Thr protein kinase
MSMAEYLESCRGDPMRYANAPERLLAAIGEPQMIDTAKDARLGRIFLNRTMRTYPAFAGFYGMEETIEHIVGLPAGSARPRKTKQILYLLDPIGGGNCRSGSMKAGDENNQDISSLVGKVDIRELDTFAQNDPDADSYSGGLNRANQGIPEFVEMFKAPIKMLHPLPRATHEGDHRRNAFYGVGSRAFERRPNVTIV